jgi:hypothetical protein
LFLCTIEALTREHDGWQQASLLPPDERSRDKVLVEVSAAIPGDVSRREQVIL